MANNDIGIDLGTTSIIIYAEGKGIVCKEPSVVAINKKNGKILAIGQKAFEMVGKTPAHIVAEKPLENGVISDIDMTEEIVKFFIKKVSSSFIVKPRVAICVPSAVTNVESRAAVNAALSAGARKIILVEEPIAAALGSGIDISKPQGRMVVDIGGGTSDIAVISLNDVVSSTSVKCAGNHFDEKITDYLRRTHKILVGSRTAESVKKTIGSVMKVMPNTEMEIKGRSLETGLPIKKTVCSDELVDLLQEFAMTIVRAIKDLLEKTPPELVGDILTEGMVLTGGGSLI
ncbi:MAG: rod shape-determining protein, partial [Oscillospiraceae bacterium]|nr:rod shape-determining protein [Oscillospiraceae bacterium]